MPLTEYFDRARRTMVVVHVENREMVEDIDALCAIDAIDVIFLGAADLSQSYGVPGRQNDPEVRAALVRVTAAAKAAGRDVGAVAASVEDLDALVASGVHYIAWQSDIGILRNALEGASRNFTGYRQSDA